MNLKQPEKSPLGINHKAKIALVCSMGGHFEQMTNLAEFYNCYDHFWITNRNKQTEGQLNKERAYYLDEAHFKKPMTYAAQVAPVLKIFTREKPTHVLSTGSGTTAFLPFLMSRLFRIKFIHIDTFSRVQNHSKLGTFLIKTGNTIYTQWESRGNSRAVYIGPIFKRQEFQEKKRDSDYVFVTLGTRVEPFTRLIQCVEELIKKGVIKERVIIQAGHTKYNSDKADIFDYCMKEKIDTLIQNAKYVITQESAGIGTQCLNHRTKFIVMPRDYQFGELPAESEMMEDLQYKLAELGYTSVVNSTRELEEAILGIDRLKVGYEFDNRNAITKLHEAVEEI